MIEYDSRVLIRKRDEDCYEVCWNVNNSILTVLNKEQMHHMIECLQMMMQSEPSPVKDYHFPSMRHRVTG